MKIRVRHIILLILLVFVLAARLSEQIGEWYSAVLYPITSSALSWLVSWIPFSLEELVVAAAVILLIYLIVSGSVKHEGFRIIFFRSFELLLWVYVWFYIGWGCNYYRESIYLRRDVERQEYDEIVFKEFLSDYAENLNNAFEVLPDDSLMIEQSELETVIKSGFSAFSEFYCLASPRRWQHPKRLLFNGLYSSVGVLGFVGPFFCETQLNADLLPAQLPFVYAHEYSHLLGVSSEDEANFWGYVICTGSDIPVVRYSGYYSILPYVLLNASRVLSEDEYRSFVSAVNPGIIVQYNAQREYWNEKYSKILGDIQSSVYNAFLKGNKVSSGTASYLEVIDMIISFKDISDFFEAEFEELSCCEVFNHEIADV